MNLVAAESGVIEGETREEQRRRTLDRLSKNNWCLPADYKFDRDEANER